MLYNFYNSATNICIYNPNGSSCHGVSGGSATLILRGQYTLIGIISRESNTCQRDDPIVLVRVAAYLDWISEIILTFLLI